MFFCLGITGVEGLVLEEAKVERGENFRFKAFFRKYKILWNYLQKNRLYGKIWAKTERDTMPIF